MKQRPAAKTQKHSHTAIVPVARSHSWCAGVHHPAHRRML